MKLHYIMLNDVILYYFKLLHYIYYIYIYITYTYADIVYYLYLHIIYYVYYVYAHIDMHTPIHIAPCVCVWVWENESRQFSVTTSNASLPSSARAVLRAKASSSRTLNVTMALLLWERLAMANAGISHVFALFQLFNRAFWYLRVHFCVGRKVEDLPSSRTYLHLVFSE